MEATCSLRHVEEAEELKQIVDGVASSDGDQAPAAFRRFAQIVSSAAAHPARAPGLLPLTAGGAGGSAAITDVRLPAPSGWPPHGDIAPHCSSVHPQVCKYQEQPQLLDPLLEGIVHPLTALLRAAAEAPEAADLRRVHGVARLLWQLSVVRWVLGMNLFSSRARQLRLLWHGRSKPASWTAG